MADFKFGFRRLNKKLVAIYSGKKVELPKNIQAKVNKYWSELIKSGNKLRRGEGFHITDIKEDENKIKITLALSDYAHYVYSRRKGLPEKYAFKNIHASCLIITSDNHFIMGIMGKETVVPGNVQCVGGGLDNGDLVGKRFSLRKSIKKEILEEAAIDANNRKIIKSLKLEYIKNSKRGHLWAIAAIYVLKLKINLVEHQKIYKKFEEKMIKKGMLPEFEKIIYLPNNKKDIKDFINKTKQLDYYLKDLLFNYEN